MHSRSVANKVTDKFENRESSRYTGHPLPLEPVQSVTVQSQSAAAYQPLCVSGKALPGPYENWENTSSQAENAQNKPTAAAAEDIYESCT